MWWKALIPPSHLSHLCSFGNADAVKNRSRNYPTRYSCIKRTHGRGSDPWAAYGAAAPAPCPGEWGGGRGCILVPVFWFACDVNAGPSLCPGYTILNQKHSLGVYKQQTKYSLHLPYRQTNRNTCLTAMQLGFSFCLVGFFWWCFFF